MQTVVFTTPALDALEEPQLKAMCIHELAHLTEGRSARFWRSAACFAYLPLAFAWSIAGLLVAAGILLLSYIVHASFQRRMDVRADRLASSPQNAAAYAAALEALYRANLVPAVVPGRLHAHPHLYDRMLAAGVTPDYPRPRPPTRWVGMVCAVAAVLAALGLLVLAALAAQLLQRLVNE